MLAHSARAFWGENETPGPETGDGVTVETLPEETDTIESEQNEGSAPSDVAEPTPEALSSDPAALEAGTAAATPAPMDNGVSGGMKSDFLLWLIGLAALALIGLLIGMRIGGKSRKRREGRTGAVRSPGAMPRTESLPQQRRNPTGLAVGNAHHIGKRENQEDCFAISDLSNAMLCRESGVLAVVADGMGGLNNGEVVSAAVTSTMMREFGGLSDAWSAPQKLLYLVERANEAGNAVTGGIPGQSGSTLVSALIRDGNLWFASVGDSRIYLVRGGKAIRLTREHVYETELNLRASRGRMNFEDVFADRQRHALTSYIGMGELAYVDCPLNATALISGDWVALMSDGVFNALSDDEIGAALCGSVHEAADRLERMVLSKGDPKQDNFTAILIQIF